MQQLVNINGFETYIEISDSQISPAISVDGDADSYRIYYNHQLVKVGGVVEITTSAIADHTEGVKTVNFGVEFKTLLDYQVSAVDAAGSVMESAHLGAITNSSMKVYASTLGNTSKTIKVKWFAEGLI